MEVVPGLVLAWPWRRPGLAPQVLRWRGLWTALLLSRQTWRQRQVQGGLLVWDLLLVRDLLLVLVSGFFPGLKEWPMVPSRPHAYP